MNFKLFKKAEEIAFACLDECDPALNRHFSIGFYKNKVIAIARNSGKTNPTNLLNPKFSSSDPNKDISGIKGTCSELMLFKKIKNRTQIPFNKINVINIRIDKNNKLTESKPCFSCNSLVNYLQLKGLYYSNRVGKFERYC